MHSSTLQHQRGATLFVSLIVLVLLTILGVTTLNSSIMGLRVAGNTQARMDALQKADAGISATMSLSNSPTDNPFNGTSSANPFAGISTALNPLKDIDNVTVSSQLIHAETACARSERGSSSSTLACEYYEVTSSYDVPTTGVAAEVRQGVQRQIIAN